MEIVCYFRIVTARPMGKTTVAKVVRLAAGGSGGGLDAANQARS